MGTNLQAIELAQEVIRRASKERPADEVLRKLLVEKRNKGAQPESKTRDVPRQGGLPSIETSQSVFNYYRWLGWLDPSKPLRSGIEMANDLARRFRKQPGEFPTSDLLEKALPAWVWGEIDRSADLVRALQTEPNLWLRARKGTGLELARKLQDCEPLGPGRLSDVLRYHGARDLFKTREFFAGEFQIQDVASQAVGFLCDPKPGETWWDACAGEGGKMLHLSDLMDNKGLIWGSDRAEWRLRRLRIRAARSKVFNYRAVEWKGGPKPPTKTLFDGVLVDAPCSGIGTWHRNPHARWTTTIEDVRELAAVQLNLLRTAAGSLKPGARLIYSVCTLARAETIAVADIFERETPKLKPLPLPNPLAPAGEPQARHWLLPQDLGGNGMFVAAWRA